MPETTSQKCNRIDAWVKAKDKSIKLPKPTSDKTLREYILQAHGLKVNQQFKRYK